MDKEGFKKEAIKWQNWFQMGQKYWSVAHHVTLFGSIICSVTAGALLQAVKDDEQLRRVPIVVLTTLVEQQDEIKKTP